MKIKIEIGVLRMDDSVFYMRIGVYHYDYVASEYLISEYLINVNQNNILSTSPPIYFFPKCAVRFKKLWRLE
jgi:hypothetical protein